MRLLLRERILAAAWDLVSVQGWEAVRVLDVATAAGVSRQTVYNEFTNKAALGEAMVMRETELFVAGVTAELDKYPDDLGRAITAALGFVLRKASRNPFLKAILTSARGSHDDLLPLLTTRSEPVLMAASQVLEGYLARHRPNVEREKIVATADAAARLTVSYIVLPLESIDMMTRRLCWFIGQALELHVDCL
ncbi:MAG TPA: TetR family transcriptional regulator [Frankiaceae bacterium]|nr:TetR family transcriptional regulator [Frankiaceae bacterium]